MYINVSSSIPIYRTIILYNSMRTISKVLFVLAILSFIVILAMKMQNYNEGEQYYSERIADAEQKMKVLENANGQTEQEDWSDDDAAIIFKASDMIATTSDFAVWCQNNLETHANQCVDVYQDIVDSNEHIINNINELMSSSKTENNMKIIDDAYGQEYKPQKYYLNHDGKIMTFDQFYERVKHCVVLVFEGQLNMNEALCDKWVLTLEGESMIFEKILKDHDMYNVDGIKALLEAEKED